MTFYLQVSNTSKERLFEIVSIHIKNNQQAHWKPIYAYVVFNVWTNPNEGAYQVKDDDWRGEEEE
jgi:hypothetical protein